MEVIDIPYYTHEQIIKAFQNRGTTLEDQHDNHSGGALQVKRAAALLHLPWYTVATALYFYHRFYVRYPPPEPEFLITGCLSLAMKAQETTKRLRDIYQSVLNHDKAEYTKDLRDRIMDIERLVLQDTLFQTTIHHPFRYIVNIAKQMSLSKDLGSKAWDICEQIYQTFLCLCYTPHEIAFACLYTSALSLYSSPPDFFSHKMCSRFDVSYDIVIGALFDNRNSNNLLQQHSADIY
ncbi:hypothetical protein EDD86DRAFT_196320 [Gorgonomyces haynaldii]|nr:hypothetical protein EDD86DRAFT_196320 [Gorgonomyces haynaldii]